MDGHLAVFDTDNSAAHGLVELPLYGRSHRPEAAPGTSTSTSILHVSDPADLISILEPEVQIACLWRMPGDSIGLELEDRARAASLPSSFRVALAADVPPGPDALPGLPESSALHADIALMLEIYADLIGCPALGLRLETTSRAMCPRFHTDRVGIRLLCTYRGPATEWLDDQGADRSKLGAAAGSLPDEASGLIRDPAHVGRASPFDIVLLKGCAWPGNESRGAIHRSPAVTPRQAPRVMVSIDALWTDK